MSKQVEVKIGDHWAILGATGSGKTVFLRELLKIFMLETKGFLPVYILDTKAQIARPQESDFKEFFRKDIGIRHTGPKIPNPINPKGKNFVQVWTPEEDILEAYDEYFKRIYQKGQPALVVIDELSSVSKESGKTTRYHNILLKQGRGLGISVINLTQSPSGLGPASSIIRQAMHVLRFRLNDEYDTKKLNGIMGRKVEEEPPDDFGFWYRNVTVPVRKAPAVYYTKMQEFFGLDSQ